MPKKQKLPYTPNTVLSAAETLKEILEEWGGVKTFGKLYNCPLKLRSLIYATLFENRAIDELLALKLQKIFGNTAEFWLKRDANYREWIAKQENK